MHTPHPIERATSLVPLSTESASADTRIFFGGSFDPPHDGHIKLPQQIASRFDPFPQIIYVPAARSPFKDADPTADHHRINMLTLAITSESNTEVWTQELEDSKLNPGKPSYWADTWSIVSRMNLPGTNRFLIGADQAISMHHWHRFEEFWMDALVMFRDDSDSIDTLISQIQETEAWSTTDLDQWRSMIVPVPTIEASSTSIRSILSVSSRSDSSKRNTPIEGLDRRVQDYILEHDLYTDQ